MKLITSLFVALFMLTTPCQAQEGKQAPFLQKVLQRQRPALTDSEFAQAEELLRESRDFETCRVLIYGLGYEADKHNRPAPMSLVERVADRNEKLAMHATGCLNAYAFRYSADAIDQLLKAATTQKASVRPDVLRLIANARPGDERVVKVLQQATHDDSWQIRKVGWSGLKQIHGDYQDYFRFLFRLNYAPTSESVPANPTQEDKDLLQFIQAGLQLALLAEAETSGGKLTSFTMSLLKDNDPHMRRAGLLVIRWAAKYRPDDDPARTRVELESALYSEPGVIINGYNSNYATSWHRIRKPQADKQLDTGRRISEAPPNPATPAPRRKSRFGRRLEEHQVDALLAQLATVDTDDTVRKEAAETLAHWKELDEGLLNGGQFVEQKRFDAPEATQAVAVNGVYFYAIANSIIAKYDQRTGQVVKRWAADEERPLRHLNSGIFRGGRLYCAHSNYPDYPEASSIEVWDRNLNHIDSHSLGVFEGSLTWIEPAEDGWWAVFAHYSNKVNANPLAKSHRWTTLVKFNKEWHRVAGWVFPDEVLDRFNPHSCSGGGWGPDGFLYCTGHDRGEIYRLELPAAGSTLRLRGTLKAPITGQGIAWEIDNNEQPTSTLFGIDRSRRQVVVSKWVPKK